MPHLESVQGTPTITDTMSPAKGTMQVGLSIQFFLTHSLAAGAALSTFFWLAHTVPGQPVLLITASVVMGGIVGLLLTINVQASAQNATLTFELRERLLHQASEAAALEERARIARDLHDSIKQQLFSISMSAAAAKVHWAGDTTSARDAIEDIQYSAKEAQVEMQALLQQLRSAPLENSSLTDALHIQAQALEYRTGASMILDIGDLPSDERLPAGAQEAIFRIVQEAFANIARHARAHTVWLKLYQADSAFHIVVRDDGQGFELNMARTGMGLANIRERAASLNGTITVQSAQGKGTTLHVTVPLLQTLRSLQEQKRIELETRRDTEQAVRGFQIGETAVPISIILIIINLNSAIRIPFIAIGVCILAVLYGFLQGHYYKTRVALHTGNTSLATLTLQQREEKLRLHLLILLPFCVWYLFFPFKWWVLPLGAIALLAAVALVIGLEIFLRRRYYHVMDCYYRLMTQQEVRLELAYKRRDNIRSWWIWLFIVVGFLFVRHLVFTFSVSTPGVWYSYADVAGMILWALILSSNALHIARWRRLVATDAPPKIGDVSLQRQEI